jgi:hypothetical protein
MIQVGSQENHTRWAPGSGSGHRFRSLPTNSTQQVGGSLGTALLNTFYASAVASYLVAHHLPPSAFNPAAAIHGYHVAFWIGVGLIAAAFVAVLVLVTAGKAITTQPGVPAGA